MYTHWGTKLDVDALKFIKTPGTILSNLTITEILLKLIGHLAYISTSIFLFFKLMNSLNENYQYRLKNSIIAILITGNLIWPIRGGFDIYPKVQLGIPLKIAHAYFHNDIFYNHTAYNIVWYLGSVGMKNNSDLNFPIPKDVIKNQKITFKKINTNGFKILKKKPKHIILIVLESFTAKIIEPLGGEPNITPNLNNLLNEGVSFPNFYASGTRSDKGITSLLAGFPALLKRSISDPKKFKSLSYFTNDLSKNGYENTFIHGGDLNFGNFKLLFNLAGFNTIYGRDDFEEELIFLCNINISPVFKSIHKHPWGSNVTLWVF